MCYNITTHIVDRTDCIRPKDYSRRNSVLTHRYFNTFSM